MKQMTGKKEARRDLRNCIIAVVLAFIFLFPVYWMIQISFKSDAETFGKILSYYPREFTFAPWLVNLQDKTFLLSLRNSFINGFLTMGITLLLGVPAE